MTRFSTDDIPVTDTTIHVLTGGNGPPLLLLHGYPQTHLLWRKVAPALAERFTVVAPDLRGYGASGKPPADAGNRAYAKRTMARDMLEVMGRLGTERFFVAGHDRGGRVAYRMALDHPGRVLRLAVLDILPTEATWRLLRGAAGLAAYHWYLLAQPGGLPEHLIGGDPAYFLRTTLATWAGGDLADAVDPGAMAAYEEAFCDPATIRATCADHRAGATTDRDDDRADRDAGRKIDCPVLVLWGESGRIPHDQYLRTWTEWAHDVRGYALPTGHLLPEEAPAETVVALRGFFEGKV